MSADNPQFLPEGLTRAQRVHQLEGVFQRQGDSDQASFQRAIIYERIMEGGFSLVQAQFLEKVIAIELYTRFLSGLTALTDKRQNSQAPLDTQK